MTQELLDSLEGLFAVSYSVQQDTTMVETLLDNLKKNRRDVKRNRASNYVPILVTDTREKAAAIAHQIGVELGKNSNRSAAKMLTVGQIIDKLAPLSLIQRSDTPSE